MAAGNELRPVSFGLARASLLTELYICKLWQFLPLSMYVCETTLPQRYRLPSVRCGCCVKPARLSRRVVIHHPLSCLSSLRRHITHSRAQLRDLSKLLPPRTIKSSAGRRPVEGHPDSGRVELSAELAHETGLAIHTPAQFALQAPFVTNAHRPAPAPQKKKLARCSWPLRPTLTLRSANA